MRIAYIDCFAGASGNMFLGALLHAGASQSLLEEGLAQLGVGGYSLDVSSVSRCGIAALYVNVPLAPEDPPHRHLADIVGIIRGSQLPRQVQDQAVAVFERLAAAEATVHGTTPDHIHFHEVGAIDAIVDVVGTCMLFHYLQVDRIIASPVNTGSGTVKCAHGILPVPAPAVVQLMQGAPIYSDGTNMELLTPTGAALLRTLVDSFSPLPPMQPTATGYGAGSRELPIPNVLRITIGETLDQAPSEMDTIDRLETNLDDCSPEVLGYTMERLFECGALDVFFTPISMKKNRPAVLLTTLCPTNLTDRLATEILCQTTALGVRISSHRRVKAVRDFYSIDTPWGSVTMKRGRLHGKVVNLAPEYEDCRRLAVAADIPCKTIMEYIKRHAD